MQFVLDFLLNLSNSTYGFIHCIKIPKKNPFPEGTSRIEVVQQRKSIVPSLPPLEVDPIDCDLWSPP